MSDKDLIIDVDKEEQEVRVPIFTVTSVVYPVDEGDDFDFQFQATVPKHPNIMDWMTFLFLTKSKLEKIYEGAIEQSIKAYLELREGADEEIAREDLENFLSKRVEEDFEEDNILGLRNIDDDD